MVVEVVAANEPDEVVEVLPAQLDGGPVVPRPFAEARLQRGADVVPAGRPLGEVVQGDVAPVESEPVVWAGGADAVGRGGGQVGERAGPGAQDPPVAGLSHVRHQHQDCRAEAA